LLHRNPFSTERKKKVKSKFTYKALEKAFKKERLCIGMESSRPSPAPFQPKRFVCPSLSARLSPQKATAREQCRATIWERTLSTHKRLALSAAKASKGKHLVSDSLYRFSPATKAMKCPVDCKARKLIPFFRFVFLPRK
jgi:hypothetical protein